MKSGTGAKNIGDDSILFCIACIAIGLIIASAHRVVVVGADQVGVNFAKVNTVNRFAAGEE
jgi:hypothetical protein